MCLERPRPSSQKGGTLIAEDVVDLETHQRLVCGPDGYRPAECPTCRHAVLHGHGYRERLLLAEPAAAVVVTIAIYLCAACKATWRILPRFVARHLWRSWQVVQATTSAPSPAPPRVPERTRRRWHERLRSSARRLVQILAASASVALETVVHTIGLDASRAELVAAYASAMRVAPGGRLADLAAHLHRLVPGIRLM